MSRQSDFERIYASNIWGKGSGTGSSPAYCAEYLKYLRRILPKYGQVLDLGSGDGQLFAGFEFPIPHIRVDVVPTLPIDIHADFANPDVLKTLPFTPDTLVLVKDVIQHWPDSDIGPWLAAIKELPWRTLLVTNNWRYFRSPQKNGQPRDVTNRHRWSPVDMREYGFEVVMHYPKGKFKQVAQLTKE
jgi:hypothetical protein